MIQFLFLTFMAYTTALFVQPAPSAVKVTCTFPCRTADTLFVFQFDGIGMEKIKGHRYTRVTDSTTVFEVQVPFSNAQFYYVGFDNQKIKPLMLGNEATLSLRGDCANIRNSRIENSPINESYDYAVTNVRTWNMETKNLLQRLQTNVDTATIREVWTGVKALEDKKFALLKDLQKSQPTVAKIASLEVYKEYFISDEQNRYEHELDYFVKTYFAQSNLADPDYNYLPSLFEAFKRYTQVVASLPDTTAVYGILDTALAKVPAANRTATRYALGGVIAVLRQQNSPVFTRYAQRFIDNFKAESPASCEYLQTQIKQMESFKVGAMAPDFVQNDTTGKPLALSSLRGKLVLVDFWASWCGPCRRENPHVKALYEKYKDKGFEILGVSLDSKQDKWLEAIQKDGLPWYHVSDLKGWQSAPAALYGVTSIPHTVLVDKEGRIIARGLRGEKLAEKLASLLP